MNQETYERFWAIHLRVARGAPVSTEDQAFYEAERKALEAREVLGDAGAAASLVTFEYDPWRGGFCLQLGPFSRDRRVAAFADLLCVYSDEHGRVAAIESFWDHGGLPLLGIREAEDYPRGEFRIEGAELRVVPFRLRQSAEKLELWFGTGNDLPHADWSSQHEADSGITLWFSQQKGQGGWPVPGGGGRAECQLLAGIEVALPGTVATFPISSLRLSPEDFK